MEAIEAASEPDPGLTALIALGDGLLLLLGLADLPTDEAAPSTGRILNLLFQK